MTDRHRDERRAGAASTAETRSGVGGTRAQRRRSAGTLSETKSSAGGTQAGRPGNADTDRKRAAKSGRSSVSKGRRDGAASASSTGARGNSPARRAQAAKKPAGKRSKRRRGGSILQSTFYRVYFAVVLICLLGVGIGMHALKGMLADYELAQPSHVAEAAAGLFEDGDYAAIYDYDTRAAEFGDREQYAQRMSELAQGAQISWTQGYSTDEDERVYDVRLNGERFAQLTLTPSGETTHHGDRFWALTSITTYAAPREPEPAQAPGEADDAAIAAGSVGRITVPSTSTVTVDGVTLSAAEAVRTDIPAVADGLLPEDIEMPMLSEYEFYFENEAPELRVIDAFGAEQEVREEGENSWSCGLSEDAALKEKYSKNAVSMAQGIARCAARTVNKRDLLRYCVKDSPAYRFIGSFDDAVGLLDRKYKFENVEVSDFHAYSDDFFSCHVSFDYLNYYSSKNVKRDPTSITLYFTHKGDSGKLYSFTMY